MKETLAVLLLGCLLATASGAQPTTGTTRQLWVWKDANGITHYSDRPEPGAKKIEIVGATPATPATPATTAGAAAAPAPSGSATKAETPATIQYRLLEITSPENGASFFNADVSVEVRLRSEPQRSGDDKLLMYLDGKPVEEARDAYSHTFTGLERGEHTVTAAILDAQGKEKIHSRACVFYIKEPSVNRTQNVGPGLTPPTQNVGPGLPPGQTVGPALRPPTPK